MEATSKPAKVDRMTVQVGDRVRHGRCLGTVVMVGLNRWYGAIQWDADTANGRGPVETNLHCWRFLEVVK